MHTTRCFLAGHVQQQAQPRRGLTLCLFSCILALSRSTSARRSSSCSWSSRACTCSSTASRQHQAALLLSARCAGVPVQTLSAAGKLGPSNQDREVRPQVVRSEWQRMTTPLILAGRQAGNPHLALRRLALPVACLTCMQCLSSGQQLVNQQVPLLLQHVSTAQHAAGQQSCPALRCAVAGRRRR